MLNLTEIAARIKQPELCTAQDIDSLKTLCETYPYSQIFPLLYLKTLAQTNDVRLDNELHQFAYRIADRTVLYDLLNSKNQSEVLPQSKEEIVEIEESLEITTVEEITEESKEELVDSIEFIDENPTQEIEVSSTLISQETVVEPIAEIEQAIEIVDTIAIDEEIIVAETEEILDNPITEETNEIISPTISQETEEMSVIESSSLTAPQGREEDDLPSLPDSVLQSLNIGNEIYSLEAEEAKIAKEKEIEEQERLEEEALALEKQKLIEALTQRKPLVEPIIEQQEEDKIDSSRSFTGWLKQNTGRVEQVEEKVDPESLIEQFIQNEPKISQQKEKLFEDRTDKNELFNPMKKAKESLDETQLPVSETLAKIFAAQGNFPKAIYAYQQLMLIFPEKKVFFATQIEELNKKINI